MVIVDKLDYTVDTDDPYEILGKWYWVARDTDTGELIAITSGENEYIRLLEAMTNYDGPYEITTVGWKDET